MSLNRNLIMGLSIIVILAMSRLIPHPPNFTPILGMAFFAGAVFDKKVYAYLITIFAMLLSDLFLGFHAGMFVIYFSLCLCVLIGTYMSSRLSFISGIIGISCGVLLFYLITNLAVWYGSGMYTKNMSGLIECYIMGLPFLQNTFFSSILYGMAALGLYQLANKYLNFMPKNI